MRVAVYPGSFDPVTYGHLDIIGRAAGICDRLVVGVLVNPRKEPLFAAAERQAMLREAVDDVLPSVAGRVIVEGFEGLTVEFARRRDAAVIVRGLRAVADFEAERQMAHFNRRLAPDIETVLLMTAVEHSYLSSALVREIASFGGDVGSMVPPAVARRLSEVARVG
jgi:pantetheine-phosphate adenylyltransferase